MYLFNKRGAIDAIVIPGIIMALIAFFIIASLVWRFKDVVDADEEACRFSVQGRALAPSIAQANIPLKCTTQKTCISESGRKDACKEFTGEKGVISINLKGSREEKIDLIQKTSAENFYSCWAIMGKGKLDLFGTKGSYFGLFQGNTCVICSRIAFADDVDSDLLNGINVQNYMETHLAPNSDLTYAQALSDDIGTKTFSSFAAWDPKELTNEQKDQSTDEQKKKISDTITSTIDKPIGRQTAIVFSQIKQASWQDALKNAAYVAVGGTLGGTALISQIPGTKAIGGFALRSIGGAFVEGAGAVTGAIVVAGVAVVAGGIGGLAIKFNAENNQQIAATYCGEFTTSVEDKNLKGGCSLIQAIPYSASNINKVCDSVQGNP